MKEFEKWWDENWHYTCSRSEAAAASWRAALEEVLKQAETSNSDGSIIDWIKKELEDG